MNKQPVFTDWDTIIMELGERVSWYLYIENTGTQGHRERAVKKDYK